MKQTTIIILGVLLSALYSCNSKSGKKSSTIEKATKSEVPTQSQELEQRKENFTKKADSNTKEIYKEGIDAVKASGILESAKNVGDIAPNFTLKNALKKNTSLSDYLKKGPVVLVWYRGGWCPYCNINLRYLQQELPNIKALGANLLALTPERPDESISTSEKHHLDFQVLSDVGNKVAKEYGVVFKLTDEVAKIYNEKIGLNEHNGDTSNELPLAATYIIDTNGKIVYAFLDADYRNRAEPKDITAFLRKLGER
ncbi:AhpC/TSA family protein [Halosquirtibacter laminarini]|uniref:AhpC/TSA family protein n=1 Tax=Halosquirtibacter laminarini TaxID=3374600 RepID=A0AC61NH96_9BACT|nr:AhpC/TSA family protein [Prolixibacteraceae bacterium]